MNQSKKMRAVFTFSLLHPKYWLTWFGVGCLYLLVQLPFPMIYFIGQRLGLLLMKLLKRRVSIARRNLELSFPAMSYQDREQLLRENFKSTGMAVFETGMAWFWSDYRIRCYSSINGGEHLLNAQNSQRGTLLIGIHFLTLELGARILGLQFPGVGVYRPNDNPVMDYVQLKGRLRSNKYMLDRKDVKGMVRALKEGEIVWYAPDHDYGPKNSVFAPFFAVQKAATTIGPTILVKMANPIIIPFIPLRVKQRYEVIIESPLIGFPQNDEIAAAAFINQAIEKEIRMAPEQYMWLHRRFKTRPTGEPPYYS